MWIVRDYHPSPREVAGGGLGIQGHPQLYGEFKARSKKTKKAKKKSKNPTNLKELLSQICKWGTEDHRILFV